MDLSIVIVNWNSAAFLRKCLASIFANVKGVTFEVLVVDNASYDGSAQLAEAEFPAVRFCQSSQNLGFAKGNNLLAARALGKTLLFLNADAEIVGDAVQELLACVEAMADAGAVGPKLLNPDGSTQGSCLQAFPTIINQLVDGEWLRKMFPRWSIWGNLALLEDGARAAPVDGIAGACLMIRRDLFDSVGRFHEAYFMYAEDMDLCWRLKKAGKTNYYLGKANVIHYGGQSSSRQSDGQFSAIVMRESLLQYMRIHRGPVYARLFQLSTAVAAVCRLGLLGGAMLLPLGAGRRHTLYSASKKWRRVLRWALGWESGMHGAA